MVRHSLVPHLSGEDGAEGVWCEFFVEPCLTFLHDSCLSGGFSDFTSDSFSGKLVSGTAGSKQELTGVSIDELETLDHLYCFWVDGYYGGFSSFPVGESDESFIK